jgi:hypothetical protein
LAAELGRRGQVASIGVPVSEQAQGGVVVVKVPVTCEHGQLAVVVSVTEAGQLIGIQLAPASAAAPIAPWEPPANADPDTFDERDIMVGSGSLAVPGTLSLPRQNGPRPAVVLLAGPGPMDRDATIGRNKPFKDLAWGLASAGVAVLRLDKATRTDGLTDREHVSPVMLQLVRHDEIAELAGRIRPGVLYPSDSWAPRHRT